MDKYSRNEWTEIQLIFVGGTMKIPLAKLVIQVWFDASKIRPKTSIQPCFIFR